MRILIVDDELSNRRTLEVLLKREGHDVRSASNGAEALQPLQTSGSDVVITDLRMPNMDGMTLLKQIQENHAGTHVIMATAFGTIDVAERTVEQSGSSWSCEYGGLGPELVCLRPPQKAAQARTTCAALRIVRARRASRGSLTRLIRAKTSTYTQ